MLSLIEEQLAAAKPEQAREQSLTHRLWEAARERVRAELNPKYDYKRLAALAAPGCPVGHYVRASIEGFGTPDAPEVEETPLRFAPKTPGARRRLAAIRSDEGIATQVIPVKKGEKLALAGLSAASVVCLTMAIVALSERRIH